MTEPYLVAMEHAEFHAQAVLRKHVKNRPFSKLEQHYRYMPPQPVLSCRTVNVDVSGTRTYRAKSAADIINEQQRLIHHVYRQARKATSAPLHRNQQKCAVTTTVQPLENLTINGNQSKTPPGSRPVTSRRKSGSMIRSRPGTGLGSSQGKLTNTKTLQNLFQEDQDFNEKSRVYHETNKQVRELWSDEKHSLDEGQFVRGNKDNQLASIDPKTGNQWLIFGGGQETTSGGLVDAFTAMKSQDDLYTIDGTTGSQVAKQLHKGDKIRVGVNGNVKSHDQKIKQWAAEQEKQLREAEVRAAGRGGYAVPLCWQDQLGQESVKVVSPRSADQNNGNKSLCESKPVIVNETKDDPGVRKEVKISEGYKVKVRPTSQGQNGLNTPNKRVVASISIDRKDEEFEKEIESLTYEDILQMKVQSNKAKRNETTVEEDIPEETRLSVDEPTHHSLSNTPSTQSQTLLDTNKSTGQLTDNNSDVGNLMSPTGRPETSLSHTSYHGALDDLVVGHAPPGLPPAKSTWPTGGAPRTGSARSGGSTRADHRGVPRVSSASRPSSRRSNAQRTSTASIGNRSDTEFIQITHGISVNPAVLSRTPTDLAAPTPGPSTQVAIETITSLNQSSYPPDEAPRIVDEKLPDVLTQNTPLANESVASLMTTPPPSPSRSPDQMYAFDIPTAQAEGADSEGNSMVAPGDLEKSLDTSLEA